MLLFRVTKPNLARLMAKDNDFFVMAFKTNENIKRI